MMSSYYFVLTFLKYLCPLEQNIKGNNQPTGASKQVHGSSEKRCSRLQTKVNRMKNLVSSAVASKTSKGGSKQIHGDSEKKDIDNCKQR